MTDEVTQRRVAAIVGRPNVGKSALFNRLCRRRIAIVHEQEGVTRDRLACEIEAEGEKFELLDTGGICRPDRNSSERDIHQGINRQAEAAVNDAAVLILVVDVKCGVVPLDTEVAALLRKSSRPIIVAANKADDDRSEGEAEEFSCLGFPVFPVSAMHNRGIEPLMQEVLRSLPPPTESNLAEPLKVAVVGRPNAGKSSYINRLLRSDRVIVSDVPGTTRDSIEVPFTVGTGPQARHYVLMDTAGIRRRRKIDSLVDHFSMLRAEGTIEKADVVVLALDAEKGPSVQEKKIAAMILEKRKGCLMLVNKWDLVEAKTTQRQYTKKMYHELPFLNFVPIVYASSTSGFNIRRSIEAIDYVADQVSARLTTGVLNRVLHEAVEKNPPPIIKNRRLKLYYAAQVGTRPVCIKLFVNNAIRLQPSYRSYITNSLRRAFGLEGAPIVLATASHQKRSGSR